MPETEAELAADSRWPAFFPSPVSVVTTSDGSAVALEKVVGASIVNRFPYVVALSFCRQELSGRHHARRAFTETLERGGHAAVQFLPPGPTLDAVLGAIASVPEGNTGSRISRTGLPTRKAATNRAPVFAAAYMVYEARLVRPGKDFDGNAIYQRPWVDVGSHRVYLLEINAIQLRHDIAVGRSQVRWRSLPAWRPRNEAYGLTGAQGPGSGKPRYQKGYTPHYTFPAGGTVAFEFDEVAAGMAVKHLPRLPEDQVEVDNDRARWPCFFPSSAGMITAWGEDGRPNLMPCGSTTVLSRHPLVVGPCVSYAAINARYAPRATLEMVRRSGRFVCGVPYLSDQVVAAMRYAGNISLADDPDKVANAGLLAERGQCGPILPALPVHFECVVAGEVALGTHVMFLGEVCRILVRADVTPESPLEWFPWAAVTPAGVATGDGDSAAAEAVSAVTGLPATGEAPCESRFQAVADAIVGSAS
jgi:flavin reductase (DIM6/NTAB) family NADH-FMN oxidoreductase RutF